tara:strand:- start:399 stop:1460 length:1062 start_codon:yes stop_codon:yes gene_type:complete
VNIYPPRQSELINIRPDERLDLKNLEPWLRKHLPETDGKLSVSQFGGGHANLTYLIRFGRTEYVLRRPPLGIVAATAHDMKREHQVLARLSREYPLAPFSYVFCDDQNILGTDFHIMERRHGFVIRQELPADVRTSANKKRRLGEMVIDNLSTLHKIDPKTVNLSSLGRPSGYVQRQLNGWRTRWGATERQLRPVETMISWLQKNQPSQQTTTLLHNDYQLENILVDLRDPTKAVAVLDWDMCTQGDPLMDLGYLLNWWTDPTDDPTWHKLTPMPKYEVGLLTRKDVIERYAIKTGFDVEHINWYHLFGVFKLLVILEQIHVRFVRGQTQDERFKSLGGRVDGLAKKGLSLLP